MLCEFKPGINEDNRVFSSVITNTGSFATGWRALGPGE